MSNAGRKLKIYLAAGLIAIAAAVALGSRDNRSFWLQRLARKSVRQSVGATVGCIPIGDDAIEEVFCFAAGAGSENIRVVITPYDMRGGRDAARERSDLPWYGQLCDLIANALEQDQTSGNW